MNPFAHQQPRSPSHLAFIRELPCVTCAATPSQAAHVRLGGNGGMGMKPADSRTVPLCAMCHQDQHRVGERTFWDRAGIDPEKLAYDLNAASGNHAVAEEIIRQARWNND